MNVCLYTEIFKCTDTIFLIDFIFEVIKLSVTLPMYTAVI
jgi:hypothetical protein